jgi:hypothetical protein
VPAPPSGEFPSTIFLRNVRIGFAAEQAMPNEVFSAYERLRASAMPADTLDGDPSMEEFEAYYRLQRARDAGRPQPREDVERLASWLGSQWLPAQQWPEDGT